MKPEWLREAESDYNVSMDGRVVVDRFGLVFHSIDNLHSTIDMERKEVEEASQEHAPCSKCFPKAYTAFETYCRTEIQA